MIDGVRRHTVETQSQICMKEVQMLWSIISWIKTTVELIFCQNIRRTPFMEISSFSIWRGGEERILKHMLILILFLNILLYTKMSRKCFHGLSCHLKCLVSPSSSSRTDLRPRILLSDFFPEQEGEQLLAVVSTPHPHAHWVFASVTMNYLTSTNPYDLWY